MYNIGWETVKIKIIRYLYAKFFEKWGRRDP